MLLAGVAVAFDLDGTLVDSTADLARALSRAVGLALTVDDVRPWIGHGARSLVATAIGARRLEHDVDDALARFRVAYQDALVVDTRPYPGVVDALRALRSDGLVLTVATNKPGGPAREIVAQLLPGLFTAVLGPDDAGATKPDPALLAACARAAGMPLAAFVGDSDTDVATAARAAVPCVAVTWGLRDRAALAGATFVVDDAAAMVDAVRRIVRERVVVPR